MIGTQLSAEQILHDAFRATLGYRGTYAFVPQLLRDAAGQTLYCNCESEACSKDSGHSTAVCMAPAMVLAEIFGIKQQLCAGCYDHAERTL